MPPLETNWRVDFNKISSLFKWTCIKLNEFQDNIHFMDIIFKCPNCEQELEVDAAGSGSKIECPACAQTIIVPIGDTRESAPPSTLPPPPAASAVEKRFSVPAHNSPSEVLVGKTSKPLDVAAKESDRKMRIKTFKRSDCQEVGRDRFDEIVSDFLERVGQPSIISINSINYSTVDAGSRQVITDYGVLVVYKG